MKPERVAAHPLTTTVSGSLPVFIHVHLLRTFALSTALVVTLSAILSLYNHGMQVRVVNGTALSESMKQQLLQACMWRSGSFGAVLAIPLYACVNVLLPVFFLSVASPWVLDADKSQVMRYVPKVTAFLVTWLLLQGLCSMNMQFAPPKLEYIIKTSDLVSSSASQAPAIHVSSTISTVLTSGHPTTDTILRSRLQSQALNPQTTCLASKGNTTDLPQASASFGFPSASWMASMLPESVASESSLAFTMTEPVTTAAPSWFPDGDVDQSAVLFAHGFFLLWQQFASPSSLFTPLSLYDAIRTSDPLQLVYNMQSFMQNATQQLETDYGAGAFKWSNLSHDDIGLSFSSVRLSPQIKFEAVTFLLPESDNLLRSYLSQQSADNVTFAMDTRQSCNDFACVMETPNARGTLQDQVRLIRICNKASGSSDPDLLAFGGESSCQVVANSSIMVFSLAHHISAEEIALDATSHKLTLKNPVRTYSVTTGRLAWNATDLAQVYQAACDADEGCNGLYFPLTRQTQHLVVGEAHIPAPNELDDPSKVLDWQVLAKAETQTSSSLQGDVIFPPNFAFSSGSDVWSNLSGSNCSYAWSSYVNGVVQDHMYSTDSYQPAYTAGLLWLFQSATVRDTIQDSSLDGGEALAFDGNREWLSAVLSMPRVSVHLASAGVALLAFMAIVAAACSALGQWNAKQLQTFSVQMVAAMIVNGPSQLVTATLKAEASPDKTRLMANGDCNEDRTDLRHVEIVGLTLTQRIGTLATPVTPSTPPSSYMKLV